MELVGERQLAAPRQRVWDALNDPGTLKACLRGCERLERNSDSTFAATIAAKVGPIKANFVGSVTLSALDPPSAYTIAFEGKGGAAGFAKGKAHVLLAEDGGGTRLRYAVDASLGGKLGQMGSRVVDGVARDMADDFFGRFSAIVAGLPIPQAADAAPVQAPAEPAPIQSPTAESSAGDAPQAPPAAPQRSSPRWTIVAAVAVALIVIAYLLLR